MRTIEQILTEACIELALLLANQTSELLTTQDQGDRWRLKRQIDQTREHYTALLTRIYS